MNRNAKLVSVLRAVALLGGAALTACNRAPASSSGNGGNGNNGGNGSSSAQGLSIAGTSCGTTAPSNGTSCAGHQVGHECEWYGTIRCTCVDGPQGPLWNQCMARAVPGPLPPPELMA
ncbi:MAG: hypothetical protein U0269_11370 [Polyangiales bacterium]